MPRIGHRVTIIPLVLVLGLAIGWFYGERLGPSGTLRELVFDGVFGVFMAVCATLQSIEIIRARPDKWLWLATLPLLCALLVACFRGTQVLWLSLAAVALWVALLIACVARRRRLAFWCASLCGGCAAATKIAAALPTVWPR